MGTEKWLRIFLGVLTLLLFLTIAVSAVCTACWGSLDDGVTLRLARKPLASCLIPQAGRMLFGYWLYNWVLVRLVGSSAMGWYFAQSFGLLVTVGALVLLGRTLSGRTEAGLLTAVLFLTTAPLAENYFTISKCEPKLCLWLALLLLLIASVLNEVDRGEAGLRLWPWFLGVMVAIALCCFTKETGIVAVGLSFLVFGSMWFLRRKNCDSLERRTWLVFVVGSVMVGALFIFIKVQVASTVKFDYTTFSPSLSIIASNSRFYWRQTPDVIIAFLVLSGLWLGHLLRCVRERTLGPELHRMGFAFSAYMGATVYLAILLVWRGAQGYLILPVSFLLMGALAFHLRRWTYGVKFALLLLVLARVHSIPYGVFLSYAQRSHDLQEQGVIRWVAENVDGEVRVVDFGQFSFVEQPVQIRLLLDDGGLQRIHWEGAEECLRPPPEAARKDFHVKDIPFSMKTLRIGDLVLLRDSSWPFLITLRAIGGGPHSFSKQRVAEARQRIEHRFSIRLKPILVASSSAKVLKPWRLRSGVVGFERRLYRVEKESSAD